MQVCSVLEGWACPRPWNLGATEDWTLGLTHRHQPSPCPSPPAPRTHVSPMPPTPAQSSPPPWSPLPSFPLQGPPGLSLPTAPMPRPSRGVNCSAPGPLHQPGCSRACARDTRLVNESGGTGHCPPEWDLAGWFPGPALALHMGPRDSGRTELWGHWVGEWGAGCRLTAPGLQAGVGLSLQTS